MNQILLIGRIVRDATLETLPNERQTKKGSFRLAVDRDYQNGSGDTAADFFPVTLFGPGAEKLVPYLSKGRLLAVSGSIHIDSWNGDDGYKTFPWVKADKIRFLDRGKKEEENGPENEG